LPSGSRNPGRLGARVRAAVIFDDPALRNGAGEGANARHRTDPRASHGAGSSGTVFFRLPAATIAAPERDPAEWLDAHARAGDRRSRMASRSPVEPLSTAPATST